MTTLIKIIAGAFLGVLCCSCNFPFDGIRGEGEVTRKEKTIKQSFSAVRTSRGLDVVLIKSDDKKVIIQANENLHEFIKIYVENETLIVTAEKNIYRADEKTVFVSYDKLNKISSSSGSELSSQEPLAQKELSLSASSGAVITLRLKAKTLNTSLSSGAVMDLSGKVSKHTAEASSGANLDADKLLSLVSAAKGSSGAFIKIHAEDEFIGKATSGANVVYYGTPDKVTENDNSGGIVRKN